MMVSISGILALLLPMTLSQTLLFGLHRHNATRTLGARPNYPDDPEQPDVVDRPEIDTEDDFVLYCVDVLVAPHTEPTNAFISQQDLVYLVNEICGIFDDKNLPEFDCPSPKFTTISMDVQLAFIRHLCDVDIGEDMLICLNDMINSGDFGVTVDLSQSFFPEKVCCDLLPFLSQHNLYQSDVCSELPTTGPSTATPEPTVIVTPAPAPASTFRPTISYEPSSNPTLTPTESYEPSQFPSNSLLTSPESVVPAPSTQPISIQIPTTSQNSDSGTPLEGNDPLLGEDDISSQNSVSVAAIAGLVLGLGGLFIVGLVSSRRRARKLEEAALTDSSPDDASY